MANGLLFDRKIRLRVGKDVVITNDVLQINFEVPFDDDSTPNTSTITIYNLNQDTIMRMGRGKGVTLEAGYGNDVGVILNGVVTHRYSDRVGSDRATTLKVMDRQGVINYGRVKKSYKKDVKSSVVIKDIAAAIGLKIQVLDLPTDKVQKKGYSVSDNGLDNIRRIAEDCGASFYYTLGKLYIRDIRKGDNVKWALSPETGLLDTPQLSGRTYQKKYTDVYNCKCLLQHRISTAAIININTTSLKASKRVINGSHKATDNSFITEFEVI